MAEIQELVLTFLERLSHNALPKNRKRETLDACIARKHSWKAGNDQFFHSRYNLFCFNAVLITAQATPF